jgi:HlyD family secretion protein
MSKKKKIWIAIGATAALVLIVVFSINATRRDEVVVQTSKVERRAELKAKVSASGEIRAKTFVDIQTEIAGIVTELYVREGDRVKKDDLLLRIDPIATKAETDSARAQYDAGLADARAQEFQILNTEANLARDQAALKSAHAQRDQAQSNLTIAESAYRRKQQLNEDGLISREEYEQALNTYKVAQSQLEVAKATVSQMETQVRVSQNSIEQMKKSYEANVNRTRSLEATFTRAEDQLKKTTLKAPMDGVITQLVVEKGTRAVPGIMSNPQATLMTIADLSIIQAELKVDETDVVNLSLGDIAAVKVDALPETVFQGEVTEIGNSPIKTAGTSQQEAKDFKVVVTLKDPSPKLRPGMSCTGDMTTDTKRDVLAIPIQALTIRDVEVDKDGKYVQPDLTKKPANVAQANSSSAKPNKKELEGVFVLTLDRIVRFRPIKTGITGESEIEVLENLKEGEEIVSGSFQTLRTIKDGAAVKVDNSIKTAGKTV